MGMKYMVRWQVCQRSQSPAFTLRHELDPEKSGEIRTDDVTATIREIEKSLRITPSLFVRWGQAQTRKCGVGHLDLPYGWLIVGVSEDESEPAFSLTKSRLDHLLDDETQEMP